MNRFSTASSSSSSDASVDRSAVVDRRVAQTTTTTTTTHVRPVVSSSSPASSPLSSSLLMPASLRSISNSNRVVGGGNGGDASCPPRHGHGGRRFRRLSRFGWVLVVALCVLLTASVAAAAAAATTTTTSDTPTSNDSAGGGGTASTAVTTGLSALPNDNDNSSSSSSTTVTAASPSSVAKRMARQAHTLATSSSVIARAASTLSSTAATTTKKRRSNIAATRIASINSDDDEKNTMNGRSDEDVAYLAATVEASTLQCPRDWTRVARTAYASSEKAVTGTAYECVRVVDDALLQVIPLEAEQNCGSIFSYYPPVVTDAAHKKGSATLTDWYYDYTSMATASSSRLHVVSVHSGAENEALRAMCFPSSSPSSASALVTLGAAAGFGELVWYDGSVGSPVLSGESEAESYVHFASSAQWEVRSGCVAMASDGTWQLTDCHGPVRPYVCSFPLDHRLLVRVTPSTTDAPTTPPTTTPPSPAQRTAHRPRVPEPAPACLAGWAALPSSVDASEGVEGAVCYRLFAPAGEVGEYGMTSAAAQSYCARFHPKASLANVLTAAENAWVLATLIRSSSVLANVTDSTVRSPSDTPSEGGVGSSAPAAAGPQRRVVVFLGGQYMGSGGSIGSWYADQYLYNATAYEASAPSSPSWPTPSNGYYANWAEGEPWLAYGALAMSSTDGRWVGEDYRATRPFLCAYLNDGSNFTGPGGESESGEGGNSGSNTSSSGGGTALTSSQDSDNDDARCVQGWSYYARENRCYRVFADRDITPADLQYQCEHVLSTLATHPELVQSAAIRTAEESVFVGSLLTQRVAAGAGRGSDDDEDNEDSRRASSSSSTTALSNATALVGVSFMDGGSYGLYLDGTLLEPYLAEMLWAPREPAANKGCVAVDGSGRWHYVPCGEPHARYYTCQYSAVKVTPLPPATPAPSTDAPVPTKPPQNATNATLVPLQQRIASLSGAVHLVVGAGTVGVYDVHTFNESGGTSGLLFYFAAVSPYYYYTVSLPNVLHAGLTTVPAPTTVGQVVFDHSTWAPCEGYKSQERIFAVLEGKLTVRHVNHSELGYVCVSEDGLNYVPTPLTYEVLNVTLAGFVPVAQRGRPSNEGGTTTTAGDGGGGGGVTSSESAFTTVNTSSWRPPLFYRSSQLVDGDGHALPNGLVQRELGILQHSTGTLQLAVVGGDGGVGESSVSSSTTTGSGSGGSTVDSAQWGTTTASFASLSSLFQRELGGSATTASWLPTSPSYISHVRLSSTADCMSSAFTFLAQDLPVLPVSMYTANSDNVSGGTNTSAVSSSSSPLYAISFQWADVLAADLSILHRLDDHNSNGNTVLPMEFFVCVAVRKGRPGSGASSGGTAAVWVEEDVTGNWSHATLSTSPTAAGPAAWMNQSSTTQQVALQRLRAPTSLRAATPTSTTGSSGSSSSSKVWTSTMALYTAVPGLKVHVVPARVSLKGMWVLPPRPLRRVSLAPVITTSSTSNTLRGATRYALFENYNSKMRARARRRETAPLQASDEGGQLSSTSLTVPQYSSPVVVFDGTGLHHGMSVLLSQDADSCSRYQATPQRDPVHGVDLPAQLDTMLPISTVTVPVYGSSETTTTTTAVTMAFVQLNLNITGMWGLNVSSESDASQTWYLCYSYTTTSDFMPIRPLRITVTRLHIDAVAASTAASNEAYILSALTDSSQNSTSGSNGLSSAVGGNEVSVNVGFSGLLRFLGLDLRLWSATTLHNTQVAFAKPIPGSGIEDGAAYQCMNTALFYGKRALGLVAPSLKPISASGGTTMTGSSSSSGSNRTDAALVVPPGFFAEESTRRMRVCLSVPPPFHTVRRMFAPTSASLDVLPITVLFVGRYSAVPGSGSASTLSSAPELPIDPVSPTSTVTPAPAGSSTSRAWEEEEEEEERSTSWSSRRVYASGLGEDSSASTAVPTWSRKAFASSSQSSFSSTNTGSASAGGAGRRVAVGEAQRTSRSTTASTFAAAAAAAGFSSSTSSPTTTSSSNSNGEYRTVITIAEDSDSVVFPLLGYGLRPGMMVFFSAMPCESQPAAGTASATASGVYGVDGDGSAVRDTLLVARQSRLNLTLQGAYDLPGNYWATGSATSATASAEGRVNSNRSRNASSLLATTEPPVYMVLTRANVTAVAVADRIFGMNRVPLHMCLYAPATKAEVFDTAFQLVVRPPYVRSIRNLPRDVDMIRYAMQGYAFPSSSTNNSTGDNNSGTGTAFSSRFELADDAVIVYASYTDLVVEGFGLREGDALFIPAVDCGNASSFLWRSPVGLSPIPSTTGHAFAEADRYVDPQTSMSSWYLSLNQAQTARFGADQPPGDGVLVTRFVWCVRYTNDDVGSNSGGTTSSADWTHGFVSTGIPYHMVIPPVDGYLYGHRVHTHLSFPTQHPTLGQWQRIDFVGPVVNLTFTFGNPLYLLMTPEDLPCRLVKNYYMTSGTFDNHVILAVVGDAVVLPNLLTQEGTYKWCASAVYPDAHSAEPNTESALQLFELGALRLTLYEPVYAVLTLNRTTVVTVEHGQEWTLPIRGSELSNRTRVRFLPFSVDCNTPMPHDLPDLIVRDEAAGFVLFEDEDAPQGTAAAASSSAGASNGIGGVVYDDSDGDDYYDPDAAGSRLYVVLQREFIRALDAPANYRLCFKANRATPWASAGILLKVNTHVRRPTHYNYFPADGSEDVVALQALAPTKVAQPWRTEEPGQQQIVGTAGRDMALALLCLPGTSRVGAYDVEDEGIRADIAAAAAAAAAAGVDGGLVPCGDHRRVMFVKPLDDGGDPCFVDAEAITEDVQRGPYVLDFGVLTIPLSVSDANATFFPNMTQPWVLCVETGPERWRLPVQPSFHWQYTATAIPVGFRTTPDDPSNTTAPLPGHPAGSSTSSTTTAGAPTTMDATDLTDGAGNRTLVLFAEDSSGVFYLNGYGIQQGYLLRFGAYCERDLRPEDFGANYSGSGSGSSVDAEDAAWLSGDNFTQLVALYQQLNNTALYLQPLVLEDDHGVFLVPQSHLEKEQHLTHVCLSTDGGLRYHKTNLSMVILGSRLKRDTPTSEEHLVDQILSSTLVLPRRSRGSVNLTNMVDYVSSSIWTLLDQLQASTTPRASNALRSPSMTMPARARWGGSARASQTVPSTVTDSAAGSAPTTTTSTGSLSSSASSDDHVATTTSAPMTGSTAAPHSPSVTRHEFLPIGTEVVLSSSCRRNVEGLPPLIAAEPNTLTLSSVHTASPTLYRLHMCARYEGMTPSNSGDSWSEEEEDENNDDAFIRSSSSSSSGTNPLKNARLDGFVDTGLFFSVLDVALESISVHTWEPFAPAVESGMSQLLLRRGEEDLLLQVQLATRSAEDGAPSASDAVLSGNEAKNGVREAFVNMLSTPGALAFFSLARLRVGKPCGSLPADDDASLSASTAAGDDGNSSGGSTGSTASSASAVISFHSAVHGVFRNQTLQVTNRDAGDCGTATCNCDGCTSCSSSSCSSSSSSIELVAALSSSHSAAYTPWAPASLCLSVDGGRHYVAVGVAYFTADWAPTLRVRVDTDASGENSDEEMSTDSGAGFTADLRLYEQTSVYGELADTRYDSRIYAPYHPPLSGSSNNNSTNSSSSSSNDSNSTVVNDTDSTPFASETPPFADTTLNRYLNGFTTDALWAGFIGEAGFARHGELYLPASYINGSTGLATTTRDSLFFALDDQRARLATGLTLTVEPMHLDCLGTEDFITDAQYARRSDVGVLLPASQRCGSGLQEGAVVRLVATQSTSSSSSASSSSATTSPVLSPAELCDRPVVDHGYVFDAVLLRPFAWAADVAHARSENFLQLNTGLRYVPNGVYALCVKRYLPYDVASREEREATYVATSVTLHVTANLTVQRVAWQSEGIVAVFQGSNAALPIEGTAAGLYGVPLLFAFAPVHTVNVTLRSSASSSSSATATAAAAAGTTVVELRNGCSDVARLRDPVTGASRLVETSATAANSLPLLRAPWLTVENGWLQIPARYLRVITNHTLYYICYSVDDGLTFQHAGERLTLTIRPPTVSSFAGDGATEADDAAALNLTLTTANALRVQRLAPASTATTNSASADSAEAWQRTSENVSVHVPSPSRQTSLFYTSQNGQRVRSRAPSFYVYGRALNALTGEGVGAHSGRNWDTAFETSQSTSPTASSPSPTSPTEGGGEEGPVLIADRVPTVAAAVAVLRTSRFGEVCDGIALTSAVTVSSGPSPETTANTGVLATPIFVLHLLHGTVWSEDDTSEVLQRFGRLNQSDVASMNPVLSRADWLNASTTLLERAANTSGSAAFSSAEAVGVMDLRAVMALALTTDEAVQRVMGESLLVCLSVDGTHFYSANADLLPPATTTTTSTSAADSSSRGGSGSGSAASSTNSNGASSSSASTSTGAGEGSAVEYWADPERREALRARRLLPGYAVATKWRTATSGRSTARGLGEVPVLPLLVRPEPSDNGTYFTRDLSLLVNLVVRPNASALASLTSASGSATRLTLTPLSFTDRNPAFDATEVEVTPTLVGQELLLTLSPEALIRVQVALAAQLGVDPSILVVQVEAAGYVETPAGSPERTAILASLSRENYRHVMAFAAKDAAAQRQQRTRWQSQQTPSVTHPPPSVVVENVNRVRAASSATAAAAAAASSSASTAFTAVQLPVYTLTISVTADAYVYNSTANGVGVLTAAPDILRQCAEILRGNTSVQHRVLSALLTPQSSSSSSSSITTTSAAAAWPLYVSTVSMNFTFSNGVDFRRALNTVPVAPATTTISRKASSSSSSSVSWASAAAFLPRLPAREVTWRTQFAAIPYDTLAAVNVPNDANNDETAKVTWWVVPVLLILPIFLVIGTYFVYTRFLKLDPAQHPTSSVLSRGRGGGTAALPASGVTIEPAESTTVEEG